MPSRTLTSARDYYAKSQRLSALTLRAARAAAPHGAQAVAKETARYQLTAAVLASLAVAQMAKEQGISAPPVASVEPSVFAGTTAAGASVLHYLSAAQAPEQMIAMAVQEVRDAGRIAAGVATVVRPNLAGYVRYLNPPSCGRCAILAGRFYRYSEGFLRHENCDCIMLPTNVAPSGDLITSPKDAYEQGQISDLTVAEIKAIEDGADIAKVVNIRQRDAGLTEGGRVLKRGKRLTPEGIYALAGDDRDKAIELLKKAGYIT